MGTQHLQKVLNEQLTNHIRENLPKLRQRIKAKFDELRNEIDEFGDDDPKNYSKIMMEWVDFFTYDNLSENGHRSKSDKLVIEKLPKGHKKWPRVVGNLDPRTLIMTQSSIDDPIDINWLLGH